MNFKAVCLGAIAAGTLMIGNVAVAADGAELYKAKVCHTCHGEDGNTPTAPIYPKVGGQTKEYISTQMKDIRDGKRANGMSAVMKATVAAVTDEEFDAIAAWLAEQDPCAKK